jgi:hypothetical protein
MMTEWRIVGSDIHSMRLQGGHSIMSFTYEQKLIESMRILALISQVFSSARMIPC